MSSCIILSHKMAGIRTVAQRAVEAFYARLTWTAADEERCFRKRGLSSATQAALGFRSNQRPNLGILEGLKGEFSVMELIESGLWMPPKQGRSAKPNPQYHGYGIVGKKKDAKEGEDDLQWGWCEPPLIPYFDATGKPRKIRPHKGGAPGERRKAMKIKGAHPGATVCGAPMLYVPRRMSEKGERPDESYREVVICEGEFKAAVLWQMFHESGEYGACAIPGISMSRSTMIREEMEMWLEAVGAHRVHVGFDREVKDRPEFPNYKADWTKRHDTTIYAQYLALDVARKMGLRTLVSELPDEWMDKGKADWDGWAGSMVEH